MKTTERQTLNRNLAQMLKGGVIMDVTTPEQAKIAEEESRKQSDFFPQFFGHSRFIKSKNFIRHVNDQQIEVIANVTRTIDSLNQEGKSTKTLENEGLFQIWYVFDSATKHFLVERYQPIEIAEKESKEYAE